MSQVKFIADLHLGHIKMAERRGFKNIEEHDQFIIDSWNSVVNKRDQVYILGDVTMESHYPYEKLDLLNGSKIVVMGNHDSRKHVKRLLNHVDNVAGVIKYKGCFLTHVPIHPSELEYRVRKNIHGHLHSNFIPDSRYICVSCEHIDYKPKTLKELTGYSKVQEIKERTLIKNIKNSYLVY